MSFESATLFTFLNLDLVMVKEICVCLHQVPVAPAAEPEVAFLVHDPYKTMMKLVRFIHVLVAVQRQIGVSFSPYLDSEFPSF